MKKNIFLICALGLFLASNAQDTTLHEYLGTYAFPDGSVVPTVEITLENGGLMASSSAGSSALEKVSKDTFNLVAFSGTVYFLRDGDHKIDSIKIQTEDLLLEGKKQSNGSALRLKNFLLDIYGFANTKPAIFSLESSTCSPVESFFSLYVPVSISSSPMIRTKGMERFSAYLNCLSNFAGS